MEGDRWNAGIRFPPEYFNSLELSRMLDDVQQVSGRTMYCTYIRSSGLASRSITVLVRTPATI